MVGSITFAAANSFITLLVVMLAGYFFFSFTCPLRGGHAHAEIEGIPMVEPLEFRVENEYWLQYIPDAPSFYCHRI